MPENLNVLFITPKTEEITQFEGLIRDQQIPINLFPANDLATAKGTIATEKINTLVSDYHLPDGSGMEVIELAGSKPVLFIAEEGDDAIVAEAFKKGAADFITRDDDRQYLNRLPNSIEYALNLQQTHQRLEEANRKLKKFSAVVEETDNAVILTNQDGLIEWVNKAFCKMTGFLAEEFIGTRGEQFSKINEDGPSPIEHLNEVLDKKKSISYEAQRRKKDGTSFWTNTNLIPILDDDGEILQIASVSTDITDKKAREKELEQAKKRAEASEKTKEEFLANMSHEIRTPLNAILGFTELLLKTELNAAQLEHIKTIKVSGDNLLVIINDILDFSKIEAGKMELERIPFSLKELINATQAMLEPKAKEKNLKFKVAREGSFPDVLVGDPVRLSQILLNLLNNAIKFTDEGDVTLTTRQLANSHNILTLGLEIKDTGIGIAEEKLPKIFESFTQAASDTTRKYGGTGLGITIVRRLVKLIGGSINVSSTLGSGTTFLLNLPYDIHEDQSLFDGLDTSEPEALSFDGSIHILLAEDNRINQRLAMEVLNGFGFTVDLAENGAQCVEKLKTGTYNLVLMDIQMPEMDGYQATNAIRNDPDEKISKLPIIAMTAHAMQEEVRKCMDSGMNDFIVKPFDQALLYQKILKWGQGDTTGTGSEPELVSPPQATILDLDYLAHIANGNKAFMAEMIEMILTDVPIDLAEMEKHLEALDYERLHHIAHKAKSALLMTGNKEIEELIKLINKCASTETDTHKLPEYIKKLITLWYAVVPQLKEQEQALKQG